MIELGCPLSEDHVSETKHCPLSEECLVCDIIYMYDVYYLRHFRMCYSVRCPLSVCDGQRISFKSFDSLRYSVNKVSAGCTVQWIIRVKQNHMDVGSRNHVTCCDSYSNNGKHHNPEGSKLYINPLNPELNPICYLLALLAHHFLHVSKIRVKSLPLRLLMSYIYIYIYIWSAYS